MMRLGVPLMILMRAAVLSCVSSLKEMKSRSGRLGCTKGTPGHKKVEESEPYIVYLGVAGVYILGNFEDDYYLEAWLIFMLIFMDGL
jgi:hypothetical protein